MQGNMAPSSVGLVGANLGSYWFGGEGAKGVRTKVRTHRDGSHPPKVAGRARLGPQETPAPLAWTSAWYDERTIGPEATWLKPSS